VRAGRSGAGVSAETSLEVAFQIAQVFKVPLDEVFQYPEGDA